MKNEIDKKIKETILFIGKMASEHRDILIKQHIQKHKSYENDFENNILFLYNQHKDYLKILQAQKALYETPLESIDKRSEQAYEQLSKKGFILVDPDNVDLIAEIYEKEIENKML